MTNTCPIEVRNAMKAANYSTLCIYNCLWVLTPNKTELQNTSRVKIECVSVCMCLCVLFGIPGDSKRYENINSSTVLWVQQNKRKRWNNFFWLYCISIVPRMHLILTMTKNVLINIEWIYRWTHCCRIMEKLIYKCICIALHSI